MSQSAVFVVGLAVGCSVFTGCLDREDTRPYDEFVADYPGELDGSTAPDDPGVDMGTGDVAEPGEDVGDGPGTSACSERGDEPVEVTLVNESGRNGEVVWIDYSCDARPVGVLFAGDSLPQGTFVTHVFQLRTLDGEVISEVIISDATVTEYTFQ